MNSGAVASIRFDPTEPVPALLRFGEALPACKLTLLDKSGSPVFRGAKKVPLVRSHDLLTSIRFWCILFYVGYRHRSITIC